MIPLEFLSGALGVISGNYFRYKMAQIDASKERRRVAEVNNKDTADARKLSLIPAVQWTKRAMALMMTVTFCSLHLGIDIGGMIGHAAQHVHIGYTELVPKFLFFGEKEAIRWVTVDGPALTPAFSNLFSFLIGHYFGSGGSRAH